MDDTIKIVKGGEKLKTAVQTLPEEHHRYSVKGNLFIVEPVFNIQSKNTLGTILMRLMQSDREFHYRGTDLQ